MSFPFLYLRIMPLSPSPFSPPLSPSTPLFFFPSHPFQLSLASPSPHLVPTFLSLPLTSFSLTNTPTLSLSLSSLSPTSPPSLFPSSIHHLPLLCPSLPLPPSLSLFPYLLRYNCYKCRNPTFNRPMHGNCRRC